MILKNEYGDVKVDSVLFNQVEVVEIINGCLCCVLVGQLKNGIEEILKKYKPGRIIIETSGSAFPAAIVLQIKAVANVELDAVITVVDCVNFMGYEDKSYTARIQAQYSDIILLNKTELVDERQLDLVIDRVNDLNTDTPKVRWPCIADLLFNRGSHVDGSTSDRDVDHHSKEVEVLSLRSNTLDYAKFEILLGNLPKDDVYRVKGLFDGRVLNWAFGRWTWTEHADAVGISATVMGISLFIYRQRLEDLFDSVSLQI